MIKRLWPILLALSALVLALPLAAQSRFNFLPTTEHLRGSVCLDETGVWNGDLIAVTGDSQDLLTGTRDVWRISANGISNLVAQIATPHLEGVTTLPNDPAWGPWAGQIITGDESMRKMFTIATNGAVSTIETTDLVSGGIEPEDFDIIPGGRDFYCAESHGLVLRIPAAILEGLAGQLLAMQAGEFGGSGGAFVIGSTNGTLNCLLRGYEASQSYSFEHGTFAPLRLPSLSQ